MLSFAIVKSAQKQKRHFLSGKSFLPGSQGSLLAFSFYRVCMCVWALATLALLDTWNFFSLRIFLSSSKKRREEPSHFSNSFQVPDPNKELEVKCKQSFVILIAHL